MTKLPLIDEGKFVREIQKLKREYESLNPILGASGAEALKEVLDLHKAGQFTLTEKEAEEKKK